MVYTPRLNLIKNVIPNLFRNRKLWYSN